MTSSDNVAPRSPWFTVWLHPRKTIAQIIAGRPERFVLLLASLGAISGFVSQLLGFGLTSQLLDWRVLLGLAVAGAVVGILGLYLAALVFRWIGRLFGGNATSQALRAVLAWSAIPSILGLAVIMIFLSVARLLGDHSTVSPDRSRWVLQAILALCGLWSSIFLLLMISRVQNFGFWRSLATYLLGLIVPLLIALLVRTFMFQPFSIPSHAMMPTLLDGDNFFVSKYAYGYSRYSFPLSPPLFAGRILASAPERGDVVVFRLPRDANIDYVKRVIGLPGDRIQMRQGVLYINDTPVQRERLADFAGSGSCGSDGPSTTKRWRESLPNGASYEILDCVDNGLYDNTAVFVVPAGRYFVLGDNRDNSVDSRAPSAVGYIPLENFIGRVGLIFFSVADMSGGADVVLSDRVGQLVH